MNPIAPDAYPVTGSGDVIVEPKTDTVVVKSKDGQAIRLTHEDYAALARGIIASSSNANDAAEGLAKTGGLLQLQNTNLSPDRQRIAMAEMTGNAPTTTMTLPSPLSSFSICGSHFSLRSVTSGR